jgi:uncharacterized membrane protein YgcG
MPRAAALALVAAAALAGARPVAARSLSIASFDADIRVGRDGALDVAETIRARFTGDWQGIYRTIPVDYRTTQGFAYHLWLVPLGARDPAGAELRWEATQDGADEKLKVWVPGASDATRTVILRYRVTNGLRFFPDHDELYWNVTGNRWEAPIETATARFALPPGVSGLHAAAYTGVLGAREQDADVEVGDGEIRLRTRRTLPPFAGLTAVVGWDKGLVREPGWTALVAHFLAANWPLAVPLLVLPLLALAWWRWGRDPRPGPVAVQYEPPPDLTPAEVGALADDSADKRDVTATLVDLAVRGWLVIEKKGTTSWAFHTRKSAPEWESLCGHERRLLDGLFDDGGTKDVTLIELEDKFYVRLPAIRERVFDRLLERGYYRGRPSTVRKAWLGAAAGSAVPFLLAAKANVILPRLHSLLPFDELLRLPSFLLVPASGFALVLGGTLTGLLVAAFGWLMPCRTLAGTRALEVVLGFKEFLTRVEGDRFARMQKTPELFERYLPYAIALGVERLWAAAFADIYRTPPTWYRGADADGFNSGDFVSDVGRMGHESSSVFASRPASTGDSGTSGFSDGGGFSGGGFGGGGGGGF